MGTRRRFGALLGLVFTWSANAQPADDPYHIGLKRDDPDKLAVVVSVDEDCDLTEDRALEIIRGVLIRSRIKPLDFRDTADYFHLELIVSCLPSKTAFTVVADYRDIFARRAVRYGDSAGVFGTFSGDPQYLLTAIQKATEEAVTEYLKANFDLSTE